MCEFDEILILLIYLYRYIFNVEIYYIFILKIKFLYFILFLVKLRLKNFECNVSMNFLIIKFIENLNRLSNCFFFNCLVFMIWKGFIFYFKFDKLLY